MDGFGIKLPTKVYTPLNKESEPNLEKKRHLNIECNVVFTHPIRISGNLNETGQIIWSQNVPLKWYQIC